eukprot:5235671-Prymnesium_polylepis.1
MAVATNVIVIVMLFASGLGLHLALRVEICLVEHLIIRHLGLAHHTLQQRRAPFRAVRACVRAVPARVSDRSGRGDATRRMAGPSCSGMHGGQVAGCRC